MKCNRRRPDEPHKKKQPPRAFIRSVRKHPIDDPADAGDPTVAREQKCRRTADQGAASERGVFYLQGESPSIMDVDLIASSLSEFILALSYGECATVLSALSEQQLLLL
jgi:hypothetical protein